MEALSEIVIPGDLMYSKDHVWVRPPPHPNSLPQFLPRMSKKTRETLYYAIIGFTDFFRFTRDIRSVKVSYIAKNKKDFISGDILAQISIKAADKSIKRIYPRSTLNSPPSDKSYENDVILIHAPISGRVAGTNKKTNESIFAIRHPAYNDIIKDPYGTGWLYEILPTKTGLAELQGLMNAGEYKQFVARILFEENFDLNK